MTVDVAFFQFNNTESKYSTTTANVLKMDSITPTPDPPRNTLLEHKIPRAAAPTCFLACGSPAAPL